MTRLLKYLPSIHIHPILIVFIFISYITGTFVELIVILLIVLIHEIGHYAMATYLKWRIRSIVLWVFGGVLDTDEHGNRPIREEILVTVAGPIQHVFIYVFLFLLSSIQLLPTSIVELALYYNTIILLFNLLPVWPLDGGKLLFLFVSRNLPYKKAYHFIILFSIVVSIILLIVQFFVLPFTLSAFLIMIFLLSENRKEWKQRYYVFIRFLLKRYEGSTTFQNVYPITVPYESTLMDVFSRFRREMKHPIYIENSKAPRTMIDENDCLHHFFHENQHNQTIGDVFSR
ncbi:site-2 protease family protein [Oceanobacillus bengalensis]|uniref:Stage IV sporulation protein FB n=1 Tax=Oceanobacillus bengalensis TaxID=1435466 RepID=A0A494Z7D9_9BACI|nr:site-2 protease family protein [Oceanobacillus bengalensis]RKQ17936.1 stage IV sporulation protein FB [Oceanobacillus bengalensis]